VRSVRRWPLWRLSPLAIAWILTVETCAVAIAITTRGPVDRHTLNLAILLAALSAVFSLASCKWDAIRRVLTDGAQFGVRVNLLAIWDFAAAVLLPLQLAVAVVVIGSVAELPVRRITGLSKPYRYAYSTGCTLTAAMTAHFCASLAVPKWAGLALAAVAYIPVEAIAISVALILCREFEASRQLLRSDTYLVEAQTVLISLGLVAMLEYQLPLSWLSLPVALLLQRRTVLAKLRKARDPSVRPMVEPAWLLVARVVVEASPTAAVMRVETPNPAAAALVAQLQAGCDAISQYGETGLAVLLADCPGPSADSLAARMRSGLRYNGIPAEVAVAAKPRDGRVLSELLAVAEGELVIRQAASAAEWRAASEPPTGEFRPDTAR
jgi:hypothetical protein